MMLHFERYLYYHRWIQINEKNFIIRSLFLLTLSTREEDNLCYKVKENTNSKNMSESCIECKCINVNVYVNVNVNVPRT